jgi:hypothetical protein
VYFVLSVFENKKTMAQWQCIVIFFCEGVVAEKAMVTIVVIFVFVFEKKKTMTMWHCLLLWCCCSEEGDTSKVSSPFSLCLRRRRRRRQCVIVFFCGGVPAKKVTTTCCHHLFL